MLCDMHLNTNIGFSSVMCNKAYKDSQSCFKHVSGVHIKIAKFAVVSWSRVFPLILLMKCFILP